MAVSRSTSTVGSARSTRRRRLTRAGAAALLPVAVLAAPAASAAVPASLPAVITQVRAANGVRLPADEAPHHAPNEWWYFSGHLSGVDPAGHVHHYGFEYVTFQFLGIAPAPVYVGNLAVTDLNRRSFHYGARQASYPVPATPARFALHTGPWSMAGSRGRDRLSGGLPGYSLALTLTTTRPAVLHGHGGVIDFGPLGTSRYYSWTHLRTAGTIVDHGVKIRVTGQSWMDHQWGAFHFASGAGWDWDSVQVSDGQQYMLYFIRNRAGRIVQTAATRVDRDGRVTHLEARTVGERATGSWRSPATGITYPSGWRVAVPGGALSITPDLRDQELDLRSVQGVAYWEGDVTVHGRIGGKRVTGVGYTEINPPGQP